jgi:hypothetical protein
MYIHELCSFLKYRHSLPIYNHTIHVHSLQVKRQKELKRRREEARQRQRVQYASAVSIQRLSRRWLLKRHMRAATALQAFLKFAAAKQAIAAATWAIATLREFVHMVRE